MLRLTKNSFSFFFPSRYIKQPLPEESGSSSSEPGACNGSRGNYEGERSPRCGAVTDQIPPGLPLLPKVHTGEGDSEAGWELWLESRPGSPVAPLHAAGACCPTLEPRVIFLDM